MSAVTSCTGNCSTTIGQSHKSSPPLAPPSVAPVALSSSLGPPTSSCSVCFLLPSASAASASAAAAAIGSTTCDGGGGGGDDDGDDDGDASDGCSDRSRLKLMLSRPTCACSEDIVEGWPTIPELPKLCS